MAPPKAAFKFMNATLPMFVLHLQTTDEAVFRDQVRARDGQAPEFFQATPVALSLAALADSDYLPDWAGLCSFLRELGMCPVGVMDASPAQTEAALAQGLAHFPDRVARKPAGSESGPAQPLEPTSAQEQEQELVAGQGELSLGDAQTTSRAAEAGKPDGSPSTLASAAAMATSAAIAVPPAPTSGERRPALVIDKTVRSGQRIYADGTDLIVLAVVSAGAELIADGDIHVYAPLRGRALAGARGNANARIFSQSMEAELVSIAGNFKILEDVPAALKGKPAQVFLDQDKIVMQPLGALRTS